MSKKKYTRNNYPDGYYVKYRRRGSRRWQYGTLVNNSDARQAWVEQGRVTIYDAIYPTCHLLEYDSLELVDLPIPAPGKRDVYQEYVRKEYLKARRRAEASATPVHKLLRVGVADGYAIYAIIRTMEAAGIGRLVRVSWRGFENPDCYMHPVFSVGCWVSFDNVERFIIREGDY